MGKRHFSAGLLRILHVGSDQGVAECKVAKS
jgi:hypothetical protein